MKGLEIEIEWVRVAVFVCVIVGLFKKTYLNESHFISADEILKDVSKKEGL